MVYSHLEMACISSILIKKVVAYYHAMKMVSSQSNTHLEIEDRLESEEGDLQILDLDGNSGISSGPAQYRCRASYLMDFLPPLGISAATLIWETNKYQALLF